VKNFKPVVDNGNWKRKLAKSKFKLRIKAFTNLLYNFKSNQELI